MLPPRHGGTTKPAPRTIDVLVRSVEKRVSVVLLTPSGCTRHDGANHVSRASAARRPGGHQPRLERMRGKQREWTGGVQVIWSGLHCSDSGLPRQTYHSHPSFWEHPAKFGTTRSISGRVVTPSLRAPQRRSAPASRFHRASERKPLTEHRTCPAPEWLRSATSSPILPGLRELARDARRTRVGSARRSHPD